MPFVSQPFHKSNSSSSSSSSSSSRSTIYQFLGTQKYLYPNLVNDPSQNLDMKYQLYPRSIQNIAHLIAHLLFTYESKIQRHTFFLSLWKHLWSINVSFQIYPQFFDWITQLLKVLDLNQTVLTYLPPFKKPITS